MGDQNAVGKTRPGETDSFEYEVWAHGQGDVRYHKAIQQMSSSEATTRTSGYVSKRNMTRGALIHSRVSGFFSTP